MVLQDVRGEARILPILAWTTSAYGRASLYPVYIIKLNRSSYGRILEIFAKKAYNKHK